MYPWKKRTVVFCDCCKHDDKCGLRREKHISIILIENKAGIHRFTSTNQFLTWFRLPNELSCYVWYSFISSVLLVVSLWYVSTKGYKYEHIGYMSLIALQPCSMSSLGAVTFSCCSLSSTFYYRRCCFPLCSVRGIGVICWVDWNHPLIKMSIETQMIQLGLDFRCLCTHYRREMHLMVSFRRSST